MTEKERQAQSDAQLHDVATFVAGQCVQIRPKAPPLPLSAALVEKAMRELHIALRPNRSTKQNVCLLRILYYSIFLSLLQPFAGTRSDEKVEILLGTRDAAVSDAPSGDCDRCLRRRCGRRPHSRRTSEAARPPCKQIPAARREDRERATGGHRPQHRVLLHGNIPITTVFITCGIH